MNLQGFIPFGFNFNIYLCRLNQEQRLIIFHRGSIFYQHFYDLTFYFAFNFIKKLHGFNNANHMAGNYICTYISQIRFIGR